MVANRLNKREQGFIKDIVKGKTATQAVKDNFPNMKPVSAQPYGSRLMKKEKVIKRILKLGDTIPDKLIRERILDLLNKKEVVVAGKDPEIIATGEIDVQAVKAGVDMSLKIKGHYAPIRVKDVSDNKTGLEGLTNEELLKRLDKIKKRKNE